VCLGVRLDGLGAIEPGQVTDILDNVEKVFFAQGPRVHALLLLRRRLQGLFAHAFQVQVTSEVGKGTTVMIRIPLRKRLKAETESAFAAGFRQRMDGVRKDPLIRGRLQPPH
jgi:hypothetical protein